MRRQFMLRFLTACSLAALLLVPARATAHPHEDDLTVLVNGTITKVDVKTGTIEVDAVEQGSVVRTNMLLFVEAKARLRQGRRKITLADLTAGQRITAIAERQESGGKRLVAFEIRLLEKESR